MTVRKLKKTSTYETIYKKKLSSQSFFLVRRKTLGIKLFHVCHDGLYIYIKKLVFKCCSPALQLVQNKKKMTPSRKILRALLLSKFSTVLLGKFQPVSVLLRYNKIANSPWSWTSPKILQMMKKLLPFQYLRLPKTFSAKYNQ